MQLLKSIWIFLIYSLWTCLSCWNVWIKASLPTFLIWSWANLFDLLKCFLENMGQDNKITYPQVKTISPFNRYKKTTQQISFFKKLCRLLCLYCAALAVILTESLSRSYIIILDCKGGGANPCLLAHINRMRNLGFNMSWLLFTRGKKYQS